MNRLARLPLVPAPNTRGLVFPTPTAAKDQRVIAAITLPVRNQQTQTASYYLEKRPGFRSISAIAAGNIGTAAFAGSTVPFSEAVFAFGGTNSTIYIGSAGQTNAGTITGLCYNFSECRFNDTTIFLIPSTDGTGWYLPIDAYATTAYTADGNNSTTITDIKVSGVNSVAGLYVGQLLAAGANIAAGSRIFSINTAAFSAVLTLATTGGAFNDLAITKTPVAKILDADFPSITSGPMVEMDGYIFVTTQRGVIHHSDLNSVTSWSASNIISADMATDLAFSLVKVKNRLMVFGEASIQGFVNAGNPSGSVLSRAEYINIGMVGEESGTILHHNVAVLGEKVYFVSQIPGLSRAGISVLEGGGVRDITPPVISNVLSGGPSVIALYARRVAGMDMLYVSLSGSVQYLGFPEINAWPEAGYAERYAFMEGIGNLVAVSTTSTSGKHYTIDSLSNYTDDSVAYTMTVQFSDGGFGDGNGRSVSMVELIADTQASGTTTLAYSDNDGANFTTVGTFDMTAARKRIWRGIFHRGDHTMWRLTHSANTAWRGQFLDFYGMKSAA